jgi:hypothetical protein
MTPSIVNQAIVFCCIGVGLTNAAFFSIASLIFLAYIALENRPVSRNVRQGKAIISVLLQQALPAIT